MLSQLISNDPFGGWTSLLLQGGSFVLLAYIVIVIWPKVNTESRKERESRDKIFSSMIELMQEKFEHRNQSLIIAMEKQTKEMIEEMRENSTRLLIVLADKKNNK